MVADLDCQGVKRGLQDFERLAGIAPDAVETPIATTPTGGRHLVFDARGNRYANEMDIPGAAIDLRMVGGYIVAIGTRQWQAVAQAADNGDRTGSELPPAEDAS